MDQVITKYNITLMAYDFETLAPKRHLNDKIVDFYINLIKEDSELKIFVFNSYFYKKLEKDGYDGVSSWTKKEDIFKCDMIIIPICKDHHWSLVVGNTSKRSLGFYDSLSKKNYRCLKRIRTYLGREHLSHKRTEIPRWTIYRKTGIPLQLNDFDCGVFICTYAKYICNKQEETMNFQQGDMEFMRRQMKRDILQGRIS